MNNVTRQEVNNALEQAESMKKTAETFIDIAEGINDYVRIREAEKRDIDYVPLDDIPLGEEVLRVRDDISLLEHSIQTLKNLDEVKATEDEITDTLEQVMETLDDIEGTLQDVRSEEVIKGSQDLDDSMF
ncbi:hypothetical protein AADF95_004527 [Vibrio alginolyticus]|eukprot:NODE_5990_length_890_cov_7.769231_g5761_i0.p1 GENE.NODE_5990_length_890_cov_7.769231_g5761_i0~~NODE_5990_length_890_cov_7.769231_g5761_i0.p1  ORF type:complete len:130 (+),score=5.29 NODE_5990_length_890_cov_7.769231_g5761_i0:66-455(+)